MRRSPRIPYRVLSRFDWPFIGSRRLNINALADVCALQSNTIWHFFTRTGLPVPMARKMADELTRWSVQLLTHARVLRALANEYERPQPPTPTAPAAVLEPEFVEPAAPAIPSPLTGLPMGQLAQVEVQWSIVSQPANTQPNEVYTPAG